jgi:hypothetical protein
MGGERKVGLDQLPLALAGGADQQRAIGLSQRKGKQQSSPCSFSLSHQVEISLCYLAKALPFLSL